MKLVVAIFLLLLWAPRLISQTPQASGSEAEGSEYGPEGRPPPASSFNCIVPLPSSKSLSPTELAGKKMFVQRCSVCHLPDNPANPPLAHILDGKVIFAMGDAAARQQILNGSPRMPGFQYVFEQADVDKIITYLKLSAYDPSAKNTPIVPRRNN